MWEFLKMDKNKKNNNSKFKTKLSTQFAVFTTMLIAITVFFIAWYSISTVNNLATQITTQSKELNDSISITVFQTLNEYSGSWVFTSESRPFQVTHLIL